MSEIVRACKDCRAQFVLSEDDQRYFDEQGWRLPQRCVPCRRAARKAREQQQAAEAAEHAEG